MTTMPPLLPAFSPNFIMYCLGLASYIEPMFHEASQEPSLTITAIVPAFNEDTAIGRTLESLLHQTLDLEDVIVVDDGSVDRTSEVARGFKKVRVLRNPRHLGKAESINLALNLVDTELVMIVDADTVLEKSFTEKAIIAFIDEEVAAACGFVIPSTESRNTAIKNARVVEDFYAQTTLKRGQNMMNGLFVISGCCAIFRTSILKPLGIPTGTVTEDLDLTWSLELEGHRTALIDAYANTLEPEGLKEYVAQIRRWYMGFFQCLAKHRSKVFISKPLTLTVAFILVECLVFSLFWVATVAFFVAAPLLVDELAFLRWFSLIVFVVDITTVSFPAVFKAHSVGALRDFLSGLPIYYFLRVLNAFVWWATFVEWIFGLGITWRAPTPSYN